MRGGAENLADFLLHAAPVALRTALEPGLDSFFQLSNDNLRHGASH